jgi:hypothetical protein
MKTKRNKTSKNKTLKNKTLKPLLKVLKNGDGRIYTIDFIINIYYGPTILFTK